MTCPTWVIGRVLSKGADTYMMATSPLLAIKLPQLKVHRGCHVQQCMHRHSVHGHLSAPGFARRASVSTRPSGPLAGSLAGVPTSGMTGPLTSACCNDTLICSCRSSVECKSLPACCCIVSVGNRGLELSWAWD